MPADEQNESYTDYLSENARIIRSNRFSINTVYPFSLSKTGSA